VTGATAAGGVDNGATVAVQQAEQIVGCAALGQERHGLVAVMREVLLEVRVIGLAELVDAGVARVGGQTFASFQVAAPEIEGVLFELAVLGVQRAQALVGESCQRAGQGWVGADRDACGLEVGPLLEPLGLDGGIGTETDCALAEASDGFEAQDGFAGAWRKDQVGALMLGSALLFEGGDREGLVAAQGVGVSHRRQGGAEVRLGGHWRRVDRLLGWAILEDPRMDRTTGRRPGGEWTETRRIRGGV
jgi:hypothetical protein